MKTLRITVARSTLSFSVALHDGCEPAALSQAVAARVQAPPDLFFLTTSPDPDGVIVPLSSALPDGLDLTLHIMSEPSPMGSGTSSFCVDNIADIEEGRVMPFPSPGDSDGSSQRLSGLRLPPVRTFSPKLSFQNGTSREVPSRGEEPEAPALSRPLLPKGEKVRNREESPEKPTKAGTFRGFRPSQSFSWFDDKHDDHGNVGKRADRLSTNQMVDAVERFSRLTTDLANERTLLAWVRTCFAAMRTAFCFLTLVGTTQEWTGTVIFSELTMTLLIVALAVVGQLRYASIKQVINQKVPPRFFGRTSIRYMNYMVVLSALCVGGGVMSHQWKHA